MPRVPMTIIVSISRRSYSAVAAEASGAPAAVAAMVVRAAPVDRDPGAVTKKEVFWMRNPETGNWMPENRFGDVDVAELRARLLSCNHGN
ncbi:hypothetical protein Cni_G03100 [Canna indica]|uniref:Uncharacterized protein n=1 Tax=Canna indica TaxID=4628 RepID=A0AAQ3JQK6_9LILI|nr:hypothetical protein Cni_G03100 [Canna indica]